MIGHCDEINTGTTEGVKVEAPAGVEVPAHEESATSQLLVRKAYTASYNKETRCPNWVAWELTAEHVDGTMARRNTYREDEEVPTPRATNLDYKGSGWSRGHMCPAGDNKWDEVAMMESNLLTNERDCRKWAKRYGQVYIVCGPIFMNQEHEKIGRNEVVVPEAFFKVILRLQPNAKAIGYVVRNNEGTKRKDQFVNSVDQVERITGIDFFPTLPDSIENAIEAKADLREWN